MYLRLETILAAFPVGFRHSRSSLVGPDPILYCFGYLFVVFSEDIISSNGCLFSTI